MEADFPIRLQHQRIQERLAELAVARPGLARFVAEERRDIDKDRPRADPLHVEGRAVLDHEPFGQGRIEQVEVQQRRILEHAERPLVRVRDEGESVVFEDHRPRAPRGFFLGVITRREPRGQVRAVAAVSSTVRTICPLVCAF